MNFTASRTMATPTEMTAAASSGGGTCRSFESTGCRYPRMRCPRRTNSTVGTRIARGCYVMKNGSTKNTHEHGSLAHAKQSVQDREQGKPKTLRDRFQQFAQKASYAVGTPWAFIIAVGVIVI